MRICPFLMFSHLFQEAVSKARRIIEQSDIKSSEYEKRLQDIFRPFICPVRVLSEGGLVCHFHQIKEDKQGQEVESCQAGLFNFQLNLQQGPPQIPPGLMPNFKF